MQKEKSRKKPLRFVAVILLFNTALVGYVTVSAAGYRAGSASQSKVDDGPFLKWYYNVDKDQVALGGYDPVSYHESAGPVKGKSELSTSMDGVKYYFANEKNQATFKEATKKYTPAYGGWCAFLMSRSVKDNGQPPLRFPSSPTNYAIEDGRLYLFANLRNADVKKLWQQQKESRIKNADQFWHSRIELAESVGEKPDGLHPRARMETLQFNFFVGEWSSRYKTRVSREGDLYGPSVAGTWKAWYGWDGFAIYDDWKQVGALAGNSGPAIRSYDPITEKWVMHFIPINAPLSSVWQMTGTFDDQGELHGEMELTDLQGNKFLQRIHFVDITPDSFSWRSDRSYDGGKTWIKNWGVGENKRVKQNQSTTSK